MTRRRAADDAPRVAVASRADLRAWLAAHHAAGGARWPVTFRKHHPDHLPRPASEEELPCRGRIASLPPAPDADRTMPILAPRNPRPSRSAANTAHVARACAAGAMTAAGKAAIAAAVATGGRDAPGAVERGGTPEWIGSARAATRAARIAATEAAARAGERPQPFARRPPRPGRSGLTPTTGATVLIP